MALQASRFHFCRRSTRALREGRAGVASLATQRAVALEEISRALWIRPSCRRARLLKAVLWTKGSFGGSMLPRRGMTELPLAVANTCRQQQRSMLSYLTDAITCLRSNLPAPKMFLQLTC